MATNSEIRAWARSIGEKVSDRGRVSDELRARYERAHSNPVVKPFPKPSEVDDLPAEEFGFTIEVPDDEPSPAPVPPSSSGAPPDGGTPDPGPDEPPGHAGRDWQQKPRTRTRAKTGPPKLTQAIRGDILAKISLGLEIPGRVWQARDPVCGTAFVEQRPEIAQSLTQIVCQSPALVEWFTGPGGAFMLYLDLMAAVWPVVTMMLAHHVYHTVEAGPGEPVQPDYRQYAA